MEANDSKYFVDGFLIKNFDIWPLELDKDNFFYEQKVFLVYLMGVIPTSEDWNLNVEYQTRVDKIKNMTEKDVIITDTDIDVAQIQGKSLEELRSKRLKEEKQKKLLELNEKFGVKQDREIDKIDGLPKHENSNTPQDNHQEIWEMIQGKALK